MQTFRLIHEYPINESLELLVEEKNTNIPASYYLQGYFLGGDVVNKNKRKYNLTEMIHEVDRYNKEFIAKSRGLGELGHPTDSTEINLEKACWNIVSLTQKDTNYFWGKAKILNTPTGIILRSLVEDKIAVGASSRALGKLNNIGDVNLVEGFRLLCIDCVHEPSLEKAMMESIMENRQYIIAEGGKIVELACDSLECRLNSLPKKNVEDHLKESFAQFFKQLKG